MRIKRFVSDNLGYLIVVGLLLFIIMATAIRIGEYQPSVILSLVVVILMLWLKISELRKDLAKSEKRMTDLLKGLEEKGLIREVDTENED